MVPSRENGHTGDDNYLGSIQQQLETFRKSDSARDVLVQDIIQKYADLQQKYDEKSEDYENELASRRLWQKQARDNEKTLTTTNLGLDANGFVLALIDGDGAIFHDDLYQAGPEGGADAAQRLYTQIKEHVAQCYPDRNTSNYAIMVQIFYNMDGLSNKLRSLGILKHNDAMASFTRAFSLNKALFNFIDVGTGKERADHKVRETLRTFLPNLQCKHVIFGGCHDNGYLPALDSYKRDPAIAPRISLLETLPIQSGFTDLGFKVVQFPSVFRGPLPDRPVKQAGMAPPVARSQIPSTQLLPTRTKSETGHVPVAATTMPNITNKSSRPASPSPSASTDGSSWATVGKSNTKTINIAATKKKARKSILLNAYDERLDAPLHRPDGAAINSLFNRVKNVGKVCNSYHLNGACALGEYCDYHHGDRLSPGEQVALRHKARERSCREKGACRDFTCTNGHICPFGNECREENCSFEWVHGIDKSPATEIFEDGEQKRLKIFIR